MRAADQERLRALKLQMAEYGPILETARALSRTNPYYGKASRRNPAFVRHEKCKFAYLNAKREYDALRAEYLKILHEPRAV
ncbi:MAG: hypothetical protein NVS1B6_00240 [Steroidobacteraceae bacterium]